jgi:hypothetical protein
MKLQNFNRACSKHFETLQKIVLIVMILKVIWNYCKMPDAMTFNVLEFHWKTL